MIKTGLSLLIVLVAWVLLGCREVSLTQPDTTGPAMEISLLQANGESARSFEDSLLNVTVLIFRKQQSDPTANPVIKYIFTAQDKSRRLALIPMEQQYLSSTDVEVFVIANSRDSSILSPDYRVIRSSVEQAVDSNILSRYNHSSFNNLGSNILNTGGITMGGLTQTRLIIQSGKTQKIDVQLSRTVGRIDIEVVTDREAFGKFILSEGKPNATLQIKSAWLTRIARLAPIIPTTDHIDHYLPPYSKGDTLAQNNALQGVLFDGKFCLYAYPTDHRGAIYYPFVDDRDNHAIKLCIRAQYDPDGNPLSTHDIQMVDYYIPLLCGGSQSANPFKRNTIYPIRINVVGIGGGLASKVMSKVVSGRTDDQQGDTFFVGGISR